MSDGKKVVKVNPSYLKVTEQSGLSDGDEPKRRGRKTLKNRRIPKALKEQTQSNAMESIQSSKIDAIKEKLRQQIEERTRKIREEILKKKEKLERVMTTVAKEDTPAPTLTLKTFQDVFNSDQDDIQLMDEEEKKMERPRLSLNHESGFGSRKEERTGENTRTGERERTGENTRTGENIKPTENIKPKEKKQTFIIKEEPAYGILKGGTKPTYSEFRKTQKHHSEEHKHNKTVRHHEPPKDWIEKDWKEMTKRNTEMNGKKMKLTIGEDISDDEFMGEKKIVVSPFVEQSTEDTPEQPTKERTEQNEKLVEERTEQSTETTEPTEPTETTEPTEPTQEPIHIEIIPQSETSLIEERQQKLQEFKDRFSTPSSLPSLRKQKIKTLKKSFILGKYKVRKDGEDVAGHRIGVLIKNNKTRRYIKEHIHILEKTSMHQIRKYLKQRNMIRAGAEAPDFLLRKLFIDLLSSGEVYNRNGELLLHNFIVDEEEPEKLTLKDEGNLQLDVVLL